MAFFCVFVIRGTSTPLVVELTSNIADAFAVAPVVLNENPCAKDVLATKTIPMAKVVIIVYICAMLYDFIIAS